jgi:light-regulated signal transduction histidine kinase (bacteriophytochrome)
VWNQNGTIKWIDGIIEEITKRKEIEQKRDELLEKVQNINTELNQFAYIISHDLKAPLRGISGLVQILRQDYMDKFDEQGKENIDLIVSKTQKMQQLIDGVLKYSRVSRTDQQQTQIDLNELVTQIINFLSPPENIHIAVQPGLPVVMGDSTRLGQVFQNLLRNAIKYMDKQKVYIRIECFDADKFWHFSVTDNGPGIAPENHERIFNLFQTAHSNKEIDSTGVGLTLVKKIVKLYGGRIWIVSEHGEGTSFLFTLPKIEDVAAENCTRKNTEKANY